MPVEDAWFTKDRATGKKVQTKRHGRGKRWRVRNPDQPTRSFEKKGDAEAHDVQVRSQVQQGLKPFDLTAGRMLFRDYAEEWLARQAYSPSSSSHYRGYLTTHLFPHFGDMQLGRIADTAHSTITGWLAWMRKKPNPRSETGRPYADSSIELIYIFLSSILKAAWRDKKIPCDPCADVPYPKAGKPARVQVWEPATVYKLLDHVPDTFETLVLSAATCGHRQGEAAAIAVENIRVGVIDIVHQVQRVDGNLVLVPPKRNSVRTGVPLPSSTAQSLAAHLQLYPTVSVPCRCPRADHEGKTWRLLFHDQLPGYVPEGSRRRARPQPLLARTLNETVWHPTLRKAGLDPASADRTGMHMLRHFAVSCWLTNGAQPHEVQQWVGHKSFKTTMDIYGHLFPNGAQRGRDIMDRVFGNRPRVA